jgi:hypothetical protein
MGLHVICGPFCMGGIRRARRPVPTVWVGQLLFRKAYGKNGQDHSLQKGFRRVGTVTAPPVWVGQLLIHKAYGRNGQDHSLQDRFYAGGHRDPLRRYTKIREEI